jgi:phenylacetaldehyde dehydrogenase
MTSHHPGPRPARPQIDLIDGEWIEPAVLLGETIDDPNTGVPRQYQKATAELHVERVVAAADLLHRSGTWAWSAQGTRVALLEQIATGLAERVNDIAYEDAMANGNPIRVATQMASYLAPRVLSARDQLNVIGDAEILPANGRTVKLLHRPMGPAAILAPWNAPTFVAVAKVASALAAGCPVILKPSEWAPGGCQILSEVIREALIDLGLPVSVFQLVHGAASVGSQLASDSRIRAISFTGGGAGGRAVAAASAPHFTALQLELGGHNPVVIMPDADIELAAISIVEGMTKLNGQWCEAPGKVLVPWALHDDLVEAILEQIGILRVGHCLEETTDVGPLSHAAHHGHLQRRVDELADQGGKPLTATTLPELKGWFFNPTVVTGLPADKSIHELFGPAITVHAVDSTEEALRAADGPETGLTGFVFGEDLDASLAVAARIPAGEIRVNGCKLADLADGTEQTFWNNAGIGGHGPTDMVRFFQGRRTIGVDDPSLPV